MMVIVLVATTSFVILLLFSLHSCLHLHATPFSAEGVGACAPSRIRRHQPRHRLTQCLLHVHEDDSHHARITVFAVVGRPVRLPSLRPVLPPNLLPPPTVANVSRPTLVDVGTGRVGHAPGLSPCMPSRTWWCLPRLGYLSNDESRSEILDKQGPVAWQQSAYATELVVLLCRFGGFRARKTLAFSRPSRIDAWCG
jgi:hypothetical protein